MKNFKKALFALFFLFIIKLTKQEDTKSVSIESQYPSSLTLNNGNILIASENGIYLYDILTISLTQLLNFTEEQKISSREICVKTKFLQFRDDLNDIILCLVKDLIYVFSSEAIYITFFDLSE